jgi:hypothetical protein
MTRIAPGKLFASPGKSFPSRPLLREFASLGFGFTSVDHT